MIVTLDPTYFITLPLLGPAETDVLITAGNTHTESFVVQVIKAARIQIHLRRAKKMWLEELNLIRVLDRQGNEQIGDFEQPLYLQLPLPEAQLMLALLRSFDCAALYSYNPARTAPIWGSVEALRELVGVMVARWEAIIKRELLSYWYGIATARRLSAFADRGSAGLPYSVDTGVRAVLYYLYDRNTLHTYHML